MSNRRPTAYREVSVAQVDFTLTPENLTGHFLGRECYRRTRYVVVRNGEETALVAIEPADPEPLFAPAAAVAVLALPAETVDVRRPEVDTGVPSQLARVAVEHPGARAVVVEGRYSHVSFLLDPAPLRVRVREVVPPHPAKLLDQAQRVLDVADDLPPIVLEPELVPFDSLIGDEPVVLLPCRGAGIRLEGRETHYLDERPPEHDWALLGCDRSRQIHHWFYGRNAPGADTCPRMLAPTRGPLLTKCCLLEERMEVDGDVAVVPWGATLAQVGEALAALARRSDPAWAPA
ncbi:MAG TPA: hypothetical protein VK306_10315 [Acidimicrobiales bacterium]|nr:hypothetical protein [Acidimicrobiales bacterium]